jgi:hypothetical protein
LQSDSNLSAYGEKALFYIAIDVSGSMEQNFPSCIEKLQLVLKDIIDSTDNWEINLTDFDSTSRSRVFNSNIHSLQSLEEHVANLYVRDCTRLYDTMLEQFDAIVQNHSGYSSVAMIVFTDGLDNASTIKKSSVVTQSALSSREAVENFQIFTIELGNRNREFFTELANEAGCTHISIDNIEQFQELRQYAGSLSESSHVLKFLDKAMHTYHQVMVEGKISVGRSTVSVSDVMTIGSEGYSIAQPTFPLLTGLSAPDAVENSESLELNLLGADVNTDI